MVELSFYSQYGGARLTTKKLTQDQCTKHCLNMCVLHLKSLIFSFRFSFLFEQDVCGSRHATTKSVCVSMPLIKVVLWDLTFKDLT